MGNCCRAQSNIHRQGWDSDAAEEQTSLPQDGSNSGVVATVRQRLMRMAGDREFSEVLFGSIWAVGGRIIAIVLALFTSVLVARLYGAEMMGVVAVINSFLSIVTIITVMGTGTSILRLIPEHLSRYSVTSARMVYRKTQFFVICVSLLSGVVLFISSDVVANKIFSKPHLSYFFALLAPFVLARSLIDLNIQAVRGLRLVRTFAFMLSLPSAVFLFILTVSSMLFRDRNIPVYAQLGAWAITATVGVSIMHRCFTKRAKALDVVQPVSMKSIVTMSMPMVMSASMHYVIAHIGVIMLGVFRTEEEVGFYIAAMKLATVTSFLLNAVNSMAAPKFAELFHNDRKDDVFQVARKASKLIFYATTPILFALIVGGRFLLCLLFGEGFAVAYAALVFLAIGQFVNSAAGSTGIFMNMTGNEKAFRNIVMIAAVLNVMMNILLIPGLGIVGAAVAGMISVASWNVGVVVFVRVKYGEMIGYVPGTKP
jgi:O-antigen/teichoic acid export membrane protein